MGRPSSKALLLLCFLLAVVAGELLVYENQLPVLAAPFPDNGGSTIPIPPPEPPTPISTELAQESSTETESETELVLGGIDLSSTAVIRTIDGQELQLLDSALQVETDSSGRQTILLPVSLPSGAELDSFVDPASGIEWTTGPSGSNSGTLVLTLESENATLVLSVTNIEGGEQGVIGKITSVELIIDPLSGGSGLPLDGLVMFSAELSQLPEEISIDIVESTEPDSTTLALFEEAAVAFDSQLADIAYVLSVEVALTGDQSSARVETVTVSMSVDESWAELWPQGSITVVRVSDEGKSTVLDTVRVGSTSEGRAKFVAISPEGFSTFALVALVGIPSGSDSGLSPTALGVAIAFAAVIGVTLIGVLGVLKLRAKDS